MQTLQAVYRGMFKTYRWIILVLVIFFVSGILLGWVLPVAIKLTLFNIVLQKFNDIIGDASTNWQLTEHIFVNNFLVCLMLYGLGFTVLFPLLIMLINGTVIGLFMNFMYHLDTLTPGMFWSSIVALIPHGLFELTAVFLAGALSIYVICKSVFNKYFEPQKTRRQVLLESALRFCTIIVPLLIIAAIVEVYVSPLASVAMNNQLMQKQHDNSLQINLSTTFTEQQHCAPLTNYTQTTDAMTDNADMAKLAQTLYDTNIYQQLQYRRSIKFYEQYYSCDQNLIIGLKAYPAQNWSITQAVQLQKAFLTATAADYSQTQRDPNTFIIKNDNMVSTLAMRSYYDKTVMLYVSDNSLINTNINNILE